MTSASKQALIGLRDLSTIKWYIIPLLAIIFYIYTLEIKKARESGNWNTIYAGATIFGMDFINETWNGMVFHITGYSAFWTAPGPTALRTMVGWNIEIMFMFAILGIIYGNTVFEDKDEKFMGLPNKWAFAIGYAAFCVFIEVLLNIGGALIWEYPWWNASFTGIWLIFLIGYFHFFVSALLVMEMKNDKNKKITIAIIYAIAIGLNVVFMGILGWVY